MRCHKHTYIVTKWAGFYLTSPLDQPSDEEPDPIDERDPECVQRWPECASGEYNPACCRFPKSCSCDVLGRTGQ
jgi:hypothetical protein